MTLMTLPVEFQITRSAFLSLLSRGKKKSKKKNQILGLCICGKSTIWIVDLYSPSPKSCQTACECGSSRPCIGIRQYWNFVEFWIGFDFEEEVYSIFIFIALTTRFSPRCGMLEIIASSTIDGCRVCFNLRAH